MITCALANPHQLSAYEDDLLAALKVVVERNGLECSPEDMLREVSRHEAILGFNENGSLRALCVLRPMRNEQGERFADAYVGWYASSLRLDDKEKFMDLVVRVAKTMKAVYIEAMADSRQWTVEEYRRRSFWKPLDDVRHVKTMHVFQGKIPQEKGESTW